MADSKPFEDAIEEAYDAAWLCPKADGDPLRGRVAIKAANVLTRLHALVKDALLESPVAQEILGELAAFAEKRMAEVREEGWGRGVAALAHQYYPVDATSPFREKGERDGAEDLYDACLKIAANVKGLAALTRQPVVPAIVTATIRTIRLRAPGLGGIALMREGEAELRDRVLAKLPKDAKQVGVAEIVRLCLREAGHKKQVGGRQRAAKSKAKARRKKRKKGRAPG